MNRFLMIVLCLSLFVINGRNQNKDNVSNANSQQILIESSNIKTETNKENTNPNLNQDYITYLKEINEQSQKRIDYNISVFSWITGVLAGVTGIFSLALIAVAVLGYREFHLVRSQRLKIERILKRDENELKEFVRNKVKNQIHHSIINVFFRLQQYALANETFHALDLVDEDDEFKMNVFSLSGKIKYELTHYKEAKDIFASLLKDNKKLKGNVDVLITVYDLIGACNHQIFKESKDKTLLLEAVDYFEKALKLTEDTYERKRILSNIQSFYIMLEKYEDAVTKYEDVRSIIITESHSKGKELDETLDIIAISLTAFAYWKLKNNEESFKLIDEIITNHKQTFPEIKDLKGFAVNRLNLNPELLDGYLKEYIKIMEK